MSPTMAKSQKMVLKFERETPKKCKNNCGLFRLFIDIVDKKTCTFYFDHPGSTGSTF